MKLYEKTLSEKEMFRGRIIRVHVDDVELENGQPALREVVDHPGGVSVCILTEQNEVIFVRQFRYPYKQVLLELPAGKLEPGEDPFEAVKREQREETGTASENYISLGQVYPTPGDAEELSLDEDEFLCTERVPLEKAVEMVCRNEIPDAKTQIGILKTARLVEQGLL